MAQYSCHHCRPQIDPGPVTEGASCMVGTAKASCARTKCTSSTHSHVLPAFPGEGGVRGHLADRDGACLDLTNNYESGSEKSTARADDCIMAEGPTSAAIGYLRQARLGHSINTLLFEEVWLGSHSIFKTETETEINSTVEYTARWYRREHSLLFSRIDKSLINGLLSSLWILCLHLALTCSACGRLGLTTARPPATTATFDSRTLTDSTCMLTLCLVNVCLP